MLAVTEFENLWIVSDDHSKKRRGLKASSYTLPTMKGRGKGRHDKEWK